MGILGRDSPCQCVLRSARSRVAACRARPGGAFRHCAETQWCPCPGTDFTSVSPIIPVRDLDAALDRYRRLGFDAHAYNGPDRYGYADRGGVSIHLTESPDHDRHRDGAQLYLYVADADALRREWEAAGVDGRLTKAHDAPYGLREFAYVDPDGTAHRVGSWLRGSEPTSTQSAEPS